jgi:pimeloyl-ACP methyl ester carboxylesterase
VRELRRRGYRDITLIGHSTGANKIAVYDHYKPRNSIKRYVLLGGGDDTGILYEHLGPRRFPPR